MAICGNPSTVPPAEAEPGKGRKPVGAPTLDQTPTGDADVGLDAGKGLHSDQKGEETAKKEETDVTDKVSYKHKPSAPVLALQIPTEVKDKALAAYMTARAYREIKTRNEKAKIEKVSNRHEDSVPVFFPSLALLLQVVLYSGFHR